MILIRAVARLNMKVRNQRTLTRTMKGVGVNRGIRLSEDWPRHCVGLELGDSTTQKDVRHVGRVLL